jgi:hypothetical protein
MDGMNPLPLFIAALCIALLPGTFLHAADAPNSSYAAWKNGPPTADDYFPIAVWLQSPSNAAKYKAIGINTYVALWDGPTDASLDQLAKNDIHVICNQNLKFKDNKTIIAWMHGDEPDNAQSLGKGKGYGPPITPDKIIADYQKTKDADPTRPVMLNLGQGVAYDNYIGRGTRRGKLEDYAKYLQGSDIASFDIYPAVHDAPEIAGNLTYVPKGVTRLREWSNDKKIIWNCIETTHIGNEKLKPTPAEVRAEVWMSLIHGSRGIIYFAHEFKPKFIEAGLLADKEMSQAVATINAKIKELTPALNAPADPSAVTVESSNKETPIAITARHHAASTYLFAVAMHNSETQATFTLANQKGPSTIEVIGEDRTLPATDGRFQDTFNGYEVHLYRTRVH